MKQKIIRLLLILSGFIPLLDLLKSPPGFMSLSYSIFILALFLRPKIIPIVNQIKINSYVKFIFFVVASGLIAECFAWLSNYFARSKNPALIHPQLIPNLILGVFFYTGWTLVFILLLLHYRFSLIQLFITVGISGIFFESEGQVFISALQAGLIGLIYIAYVFIIYGSVFGTAYMMVEEELRRNWQKDSWFKYPLAWLLLTLNRFLIGTITAITIKIKILPEAHPIWERLFW